MADRSEDSTPQQWLLVTVSTAGAPASLRVQVWRTLRGLGALYLHQSVCLLPAVPPVLEQVDRLLDRVRRQGGTGRCLRLSLDDPGQQSSIIAEFRAARDEEYAEVLDRVPALIAELEFERGRGRASYAEVEESEADLARFHSWLGKIEARDYFEATMREPARAAVNRCRAELAAFEQEAMAIEAPMAAPDRTAAAVMAVTDSDLGSALQAGGHGSATTREDEGGH